LNDYLLSVLLGIVEGLTEFLPVSSTAHLRLAEELMHVPLSSGYWKMYSIVIQLGATRQPNPCYAFINSVPSETWGWYMWLPANQVVWRCSKNGGPYRYIVGVDSGPLAPSNRMDPNACQ